MIEHHENRKGFFLIAASADRREIFAAMATIGVNKSRITIHSYPDGSTGVELRPLGRPDVSAALNDLKGRMSARGLPATVSRKPWTPGPPT